MYKDYESTCLFLRALISPRLAAVTFSNEAWWGSVLILLPSLHLPPLVPFGRCAQHGCITWPLSFVCPGVVHVFACSLVSLFSLCQSSWSWKILFSYIILLKFKDKPWKTMTFSHRLCFFVVGLGIFSVRDSWGTLPYKCHILGVLERKCVKVLQRCSTLKTGAWTGNDCVIGGWSRRVDKMFMVIPPSLPHACTSNTRNPLMCWSLNKAAASKCARNTRNTLHRKEVNQVMQQVDKVWRSVSEVWISFTLVTWIATVILHSSGTKNVCRNSLLELAVGVTEYFPFK